MLRMVHDRIILLPLIVPVLTITHAHSCPKGGYPSIRHNKIWDLTAEILSEVCHSVSIEPHLHPVRGEVGSSANVEDGA